MCVSARDVEPRGMLHAEGRSSELRDGGCVSGAVGPRNVKQRVLPTVSRADSAIAAASVAGRKNAFFVVWQCHHGLHGAVCQADIDGGIGFCLRDFD